MGIYGLTYSLYHPRGGGGGIGTALTYTRMCLLGPAAMPVKYLPVLGCVCWVLQLCLSCIYLCRDVFVGFCSYACHVFTCAGMCLLGSAAMPVMYLPVQGCVCWVLQLCLSCIYLCRDVFVGFCSYACHVFTCAGMCLLGSAAMPVMYLPVQGCVCWVLQLCLPCIYLFWDVFVGFCSYARHEVCSDEGPDDGRVLR